MSPHHQPGGLTKPETGQRETENSRLLARSPDAFGGQWAGLKPGAWTPARLSPVGDRNPLPSRGSRQQKLESGAQADQSRVLQHGLWLSSPAASACLPPGALTSSVPRTSPG